MKPKKLLKEYYYLEESDTDLRLHGSSVARRDIYLYENKDCVVAYLKNSCGTLFIMKTVKTYRSYYCTSKELVQSWYNLILIRLVDCVRLIEKDKSIIIDKKEYNNLKKSLLLKHLLEGK